MLGTLACLPLIRRVDWIGEACRLASGQNKDIRSVSPSVAEEAAETNFWRREITLLEVKILPPILRESGEIGNIYILYNYIYIHIIYMYKYIYIYIYIQRIYIYIYIYRERERAERAEREIEK